MSTTPPCRVCGRSAEVICYPDDHSQTLCPDCCDTADHANGEHGHQWEYDRRERDRVCQHCCIQQRCTRYAYDHESE